MSFMLVSPRLRAVFAPAFVSLFASGAGATPLYELSILQNATSAVVEGASDGDSGAGSARTESYAEVNGQSPLNYKWFASGLADGGHLEVGVDLSRPACCVVGNSDATASADYLVTNPLDIVLTDLKIQLDLPDGEVLFRLPPTLQPVADQDRGFFDAAVFVGGAAVPLFHYRLELVTTNGGFEEDPSSTSNVPIDQIFNGSGGVWGYTTLPYTEVFALPDLQPNEQLSLHYEMTAHGFNEFQHGEVGAGFSVKLGDPLTFTAGSGHDLVPEPGTSWLLGSALAALGLGSGRLAQNRSSTSTPIQSSSR